VGEEPIKRVRRSICLGTSDLETLDSSYAGTVFFRRKWRTGRRVVFPIVVLVLIFLCRVTDAQTNQWTWEGGSNVNNESPVYGVLGTPAAGNIPGSRYLAATWTDRNGNLWLFGGGWGSLGSDEVIYDDLWEFNPSTKQWAWVGGPSLPVYSLNSPPQPGVYGTQGKAAPSNMPGARDAAATWTDSAGHFWLFGGVGFDSAGNAGLLNDLWEFDPSTMEWTWVSGSAFGNQTGVYGTLGAPATANIPGGRQLSTSWSDKSGNLWLFGGYVIIELPNGSGDLAGFNDLWKFNPSTSEWTWMGGDNAGCDYGVQSGVWGTMGTPAAGNIPSCRYGASGWADSSGNFWLFGGEGRDIDGYWGDLNNVWEFNPSANEWAWMGGTNIIDLPAGAPPGSYGIVGVPAAGNIPAGRHLATAWYDSSGNFWLMGGVVNGFEGDSGWSYLNDLWEFSPAANEWTWMNGSSSLANNTVGVYGTLGMAGATNTPGGRWGGAGWTDRNGNLWLFGGEGFANSPLIPDLSDLWNYSPLAPTPKPSFAVLDLNNPALNNAQSFVVQAGTSGQTTINTVVSDGFASAITLEAIGLPNGITATFSPGTITGDGSSQVTFSVGYAVAQGNYTLTVAGISQGVTETTTIPLTISSPPPPTFTLSVLPTALTVSSGSQGVATLTVTPKYGFNSTLTFACSGLPSGAACSFSPATVTPSGAATATTQLTISTSTQSSASRTNSRPFPTVTAMAALLFLFGWRRRRGLQLVLLLAASYIGLVLVLGCGGIGSGSRSGGGSGGSAPPVTSMVTITVMGTQQTATLSLTVN
jgi:hypothetical protein